MTEQTQEDGAGTIWWGGKPWDFQLKPRETPPTPVPIPDAVRIGSATYPLSGVNATAESNPAGAKFPPAFRGEDQIIAVRDPAESVTTNRYGCTIIVGSGGLILAVRDDLPGASPTAPPVTTAVPADGMVLTCHGKGRGWALANARQGGTVELVQGQAPTPTPSGRPVLGVYLMDGVGHVSQIPPQCNRILIAFYQGTDLVEWGGDTPAQTAAALNSWHQQNPEGREILLSLGGQGGQVDLASVPAGISRILGRFPVHGIDFDAEAFTYDEATAVTLCRAAAAIIGPRFVAQFVPPGGDPTTKALSAAKAVQAIGLQVNFGQQGYETSISDSDVMTYTGRAVQALGAESVLVGMMLGDSHNSWTAASAESRMRAVVAKWPKIRGSYLWESSRPGTSEWAARVGSVLGL